MGRLSSLADPMKATPTDKAPGGRSSAVAPPAPVDADLLDAIIDVSRTLTAWDRFVAPVSMEQALEGLVNDLEHVERLGTGYLDRNDPVDGIRPFWSVADAMAKWGAERRTRNETEWVDDVTSEDIRAVPEWGDPLLNRADAEKLIPARTLRRWVQKDLVAPVGTIYVAGVRTVLYRRSDLLRCQDEMKKHVGRPRSNRPSEGERQ
ncbi:hypothetical protein [Microbacterium sp. J1-1]|uniref:hypothetical protein n=1 Tax=Microbacterium sp. J1-1 TaxID=2992441 RepID=UPI00211417E6|nr:hypothetical protein [Microbacterium sp. J1-1]UUE19340.1 hypothetical protein LRQ07_11015 [Microbacterium sp. J1-1]